MEVFTIISNEEILLGIVVMVLEGAPQALIVVVNAMHWHEPVETLSLELFATLSNIPLRFNQ